MYSLRYMLAAMRQAKKSLRLGEVPVGAVVVDAQGRIVGRGYNQMEKKSSQQGHAEMQALKKAARHIGGWRLEGCWLYVTLEPCLMCLGCALLSRVKGIIYGAESPQFGAVEMVKALPEAYKPVIIHGGLQEPMCSDMLKSFFQQVRKEKRDLL